MNKFTSIGKKIREARKNLSPRPRKAPIFKANFILFKGCGDLNKLTWEGVGEDLGEDWENDFSEKGIKKAPTDAKG